MILLGYSSNLLAAIEPETESVSATVVGCPACEAEAKKQKFSKALDEAMIFIKGIRPEFGFGVDHFDAARNQIWYEKDKPHSLHLVRAMARVGIVAPVGKGVNLHVGVEGLSLGGVKSHAIAIADDTNYWACDKPGSKVKCNDTSTWIGHGEVSDVYFMAGHDFKIPFVKNTQFVAEAGFTEYRPTWYVTVPDYTNGIGTPREFVKVQHDAKFLTGIAGDIGLARGNFKMLITYRTINAGGDNYQAVYRRAAEGIEVLYSPKKKDN